MWSLCLSAQSNPQGVPKELLEAKKQELKQEKVILALQFLQSIADYLDSWRPNEQQQRAEDVVKKSKPETETLRTSGNENEGSGAIAVTAVIEVVGGDALGDAVIMEVEAIIVDEEILVAEENTTDVLQDNLDLHAVDHHLRLRQELLTRIFHLRIEDERSDVGNRLHH